MKQKDILLLIIPLFIIITAGIGFSIYHNFISSTISQNLNTNIIPIKPNFDTETIQNLKERNKLKGVYEIPTPPIINQASEGASTKP